MARTVAQRTMANRTMRLTQKDRTELFRRTRGTRIATPIWRIGQMAKDGATIGQMQTWLTEHGWQVSAETTVRQLLGRQANEELVRIDNAELGRQMAETGDESGIEDDQEANTPTVPHTVVFSDPPTNLQLAERALQLLEAADEDHGLDEDEDAAAGLIRELAHRLRG